MHHKIQHDQIIYEKTKNRSATKYNQSFVNIVSLSKITFKSLIILKRISKRFNYKMKGDTYSNLGLDFLFNTIVLDT